MPVTKPPIIWKGAHPNNFSVGRQRHGGKVVLNECVVVHTTGGGQTIEALQSWFNNPDAHASTTFGIGPTAAGKVEIHQYVSLDDTPYAHGIMQAPTARLAIENGGISPNLWAIGVELIDGGTPGNHSAAMLIALWDLFAWLFEDVILPNKAITGAAVDRDHILGHYQITSVDRAQCPSWPEARYTATIAAVKQRLGGVVLPPPPPDPLIALRAQVATLTAEVARLRGALVLTRQGLVEEAGRLAAEHQTRAMRLALFREGIDNIIGPAG